MDVDRYSFVALSVTIGITLFSWLYFGWFHTRRNLKKNVPCTERTAPVSKRKVEPSSQQGGGRSSDVWEERRRRGIQAASMHVKPNVAKEQKPFGSSYYYAHNSTKAAGGYKDGLTMEDFTMNGPRLLTRNGQPVDDMDLPAASAAPSRPIPGPSSSADQDAPKSSMPPPPPARNVLMITRYLWDDPGQGVGTIRIDVLPSLQPGDASLIPWSEIRPLVTNISATLIPSDDRRPKKDEALGLWIEIAARSATDGDVRYSLRIPRLYGPVKQVETMNKDKRLLIRLYKASTSSSSSSWWDQSHKQSWPHPQKAL
jgi:hypothetical protein